MTEPSAPTEHWEPIPLRERRVLGVLVEKQKTSKSPDAYPMTLNALTTGCNQKSNRDPILDLNEDEVEETLIRLQQRGLVSKLVGGRADRWRHLLYEAWHVSKVELAILAELLLRGPQSEGDLRGRASRMDDIADLDVLRSTLKPMADRKLIVYVTPPDRRGTILTHGFHAEAEIEAARQKFSSGAVSISDTAPPTRSHVPAAPEASETQQKLDQALREIESLKTAIAELQGEMKQIRQQLGIA